MQRRETQRGCVSLHVCLAMVDCPFLNARPALCTHPSLVFVSVPGFGSPLQYGTINYDAVIGELAVLRTEDGTFTKIEEFVNPEK